LLRQLTEKNQEFVGKPSRCLLKTVQNSTGNRTSVKLHTTPTATFPQHRKLTTQHVATFLEFSSLRFQNILHHSATFSFPSPSYKSRALPTTHHILFPIAAKEAQNLREETDNAVC
jgi:hypothetical protein